LRLSTAASDRTRLAQAHGEGALPLARLAYLRGCAALERADYKTADDALRAAASTLVKCVGRPRAGPAGARAVVMPPLPILCQARLAQKSLAQGRLAEARTIFGNVLSGYPPPIPSLAPLLRPSCAPLAPLLRPSCAPLAPSSRPLRRCCVPHAENATATARAGSACHTSTSTGRSTRSPSPPFPAPRHFLCCHALRSSHPFRSHLVRVLHLVRISPPRPKLTPPPLRNGQAWVHEEYAQLLFRTGSPAEAWGMTQEGARARAKVPGAHASAAHWPLILQCQWEVGAPASLLP
jgi:hypothetical protein